MRPFAFIPLLYLCRSIFAQEPDWEKILGNETESEDEQTVQQFLEWLQEKPLDINRASARDLQQLPWLDPLLAHRMIAFRREQGPYQSVRQLLLVHGMTESLLMLLTPFIECKDLRPVTNWGVNARWRLLQPLQTSRGYLENHYPGSNTKMAGRLQSHVGAFLQWGALFERDAGERSATDYTCGYLSVALKKPDLTVMIGDLTVECGQGLVFTHPGQWSGDWEAMAGAKKRQRTLRPWLSTDENAGLRGGAVQSRIGRFEMTGLYSSTRIDASFTDQAIRSFPADGLHRTAGELAAKDLALKTTAGAILNWLVDSETSFGLSIQRTGFNHVVKKQDRADNLFSFSGRQNVVLGLNWDVLLHEINCFGEIAWGGKTAAVKTGLWWDWRALQSVLQLSILPPLFHNPLYPHLALPANNLYEWLCLQKWRFANDGTCSFAYERTVHRWLRYHLPLAFGLSEQWRLVVELALRKELLFTLRGKTSSSPAAKTAVDGQKTVYLQRRHSLQSQLDWEPGKNLALRTRLEWNQVQQGSWMTPFRSDSQGVALYQQGRIRFKKTVALWARALWFHSPGSDNSFYEFEQDMPGLMRIKTVYGKGFRWFVLLTWQLYTLQLSAKYEETRYKDRDHISSGWDEIAGNRERLAALQCDWHW